MPIGQYTRISLPACAHQGLAMSVVVSCCLLAGCGERAPAPAPAVAPTRAAAVHTPPPDYPPELACYEKGGTVGLIMKIGVDGVPKDIRIESNSGFNELDRAALEAVKGWEFRPATRGGSAIETDLRVPVTFSPPLERPALCFQLDERL